jgi:hypothetical protein
MTVHRFQPIADLAGKTIKIAAFVIRQDMGPKRRTVAELDLVFTDGSSATIQCVGANIEVDISSKKEGK